MHFHFFDGTFFNEYRAGYHLHEIQSYNRRVNELILIYSNVATVEFKFFTCQMHFSLARTFFIELEMNGAKKSA